MAVHSICHRPWPRPLLLIQCLSICPGSVCLCSVAPPSVHGFCRHDDVFVLSVSQVDFLALEMRKGKVNFLWDVGSGVGRVEYPHVTIHDGSWHRIEASRWVHVLLHRRTWWMCISQILYKYNILESEYKVDILLVLTFFLSYVFLHESRFSFSEQKLQ